MEKQNVQAEKVYCKFRIVLEQKNKDGAEGTNLHFPLYKQRTVSLVVVLLF